MADDPATENVEELETGPETEEVEEIETEEEAEPEGDDAEGEEESEEASGEGEGETEPERPSRGANLRHRAQEAERRAAELQERVERLERAGTGRQTADDAAREEQEFRRSLEMLTPEERAEKITARAERRMENRLAQTQFTLVDQNDKSAFDARAATDPVYRRYQDRVETELAAMRRNGMNVPRERLLAFLIGQDALKRRGEAGGRQRKRTEQERARQTPKAAGGGRSDARATAKGKQPKTAAERLEDVTF